MNTSTVDTTPSKSSLARIDWLAAIALLAPWLAAAWLPPFAQPQSFHDYADQHAWFGLPHAADVLSNLPFIFLGVLGLRLVLRLQADRRSTLPYALMFAGVVLTAFGSAWYHATPSDATLVWDRLPMALAFAGLVAGTLCDRASQRSALFTALFAISGAASVLYWHATANLTPYLTMQASFIAAALIAAAAVPARYALAHRLYWAAATYALALVFERLDHPVHALTGGLISGHTVKHLLAAAAILMIYTMLRDRRAG